MSEGARSRTAIRFYGGFHCGGVELFLANGFGSASVSVSSKVILHWCNDTHLEEQYGINSMTLIRMLLTLEGAFNFEFTSDELVMVNQKSCNAIVKIVVTRVRRSKKCKIRYLTTHIAYNKVVTVVEFFWISFKNAFVYRSSVIFSILGSLFWVFVQIALWTYIYRGTEQMIEYMIAYVILANMIKIFYSKEMGNMIGGKVSSGNFVYDLLRPTHLITMSYQLLLGKLASNVLMQAVPQALILFPLIHRSLHFANLLPFFIAVIIGHFLFVILYALVGFLAFVVIEIWPFGRLLEDTIRFVSGSVIPLALFPGWLQTLSAFLPFKYLFDFPLRLLLDDVSTAEVIHGLSISVVWLVALGSLLLFSYNSAINRCTVQGG